MLVPYVGFLVDGVSAFSMDVQHDSCSFVLAPQYRYAPCHCKTGVPDHEKLSYVENRSDDEHCENIID